jgi:hypothetical protein
MMKFNEPTSAEDHAREDAEYSRIRESQISFLNEIAALIKSEKPLNSMQREWAVLAIQRLVETIPLKRKRAGGRPAKIPVEALLLRQAYIERGMTVTEAEEKLAARYTVDLETVQSRIKRLSKKIDPILWGFEKWGAN